MSHINILRSLPLDRIVKPFIFILTIRILKKHIIHSDIEIPLLLNSDDDNGYCRTNFLYLQLQM